MKKIPFLIDILATGFYSGKIPFMPGTFGSLVAIPIGFLLYLTPYLSIRIGVTALIFFIGAYVADKYSKITGAEDPGSIVIDEVVGLLIVYIFVDTIFATSFNFLFIITGFILFRIFDILKPFPVSYFDNIKNGWGIMLDDVVAGLYALLFTFLLYKYVYPFIGLNN